MKRLQNRMAESRRTLPLALLYAVAVWMAAGLVSHGWWVQLGCFLLSVYLMVELNNRNLLIRIYSRAVSATFILLFSTAVFLFPSANGGIVEVTAIVSLMLLYDCYQDKTAVGLTFYIFLALGVGSIADVSLLVYVPVYWMMMAVVVYSFSGRTFLASLLGLLTPYWFLAGWMVYQDGADLTALADHFAQLATVASPADYRSVALPQLLFFLTAVVLWLTGCIHYLRKSSFDKIRVRQLYYGFILLGLVSILLLILLPQRYGTPGRMLIITASPLFGHFAALTNTKLSNLTVCTLGAATVAICIFNLWMSLSAS